MFAIQILLPLRSNTGAPFPPSQFDEVSRILTETFGGITAYLRSPANGSWQDDQGSIRHDDIIVYEVLADSLEANWWADYRRALEAMFCQEEILVRAHEVWKL
jgi:hypothetical protein